MFNDVTPETNKLIKLTSYFCLIPFQKFAMEKPQVFVLRSYLLHVDEAARQ